MTYIYIDPLGTTTLISTTTSLDDTIADDDLKSTTITGLATSLTSSISTPASADMYYTDKYIDSLTDEQIIEMSKLLDDKTAEIGIEDNIEKPKVYQKTINT